MNMNSKQTPTEDSNEGEYSSATAGNGVPPGRAGHSFWRHIRESTSRHQFFYVLLAMLYLGVKVSQEGKMFADGRDPSDGSTMLITLITFAAFVCVAFAMLTVYEYWMGKTTQSPPSDTAEKNTQRTSGIAFAFVLWLIFRPHPSQTSPPRINNSPSAKVISPRETPPAQPIAVRATATLAYWNTAVGKLHEVRFKVTPSERPSEQVWNEYVSQLKVLSNQANVAPWDNVDPELVQMVIRHSVIDGKAFQLKTQIDELRKQNPTSPENSVSFNQAMTIGQQIMSAVEADSDILKKLPEGPIRKFVEAAVEYEQLALDQLHEIEAMQSTLQERYPGTEFPLSDLGE